MRIQNISVRGLYGIFDHEIPMNNPERVTLIHGPNGFGKTVMLKMIAGALTGDMSMFRNTPFDDFRMEFSDGTAWAVSRRVEQSSASRKPEVILEFRTIDNAGLVAHIPQHTDDLPPSVLDRVDRLVPGPYRRVGHGWQRADTGESFSLREILERFPRAASALPPGYATKVLGRRLKAKDLPVFVVEANRLEAASAATSEGIEDEDEIEESTTPDLRVQQYARDVVQRLKSVLAHYAKHSQERDRTFPERLVQFVREERPALEERNILSQMQELEKKRQRLITLGFLDSETGLRDLTEEDVHRAKEALTIYVEDVQQKLSAFDDMAQRVGKLMDIVNDRFAYKQLKIHRDQGFVVVGDNGGTVQLSALSSGEQHELVLLYELLFRTPRDGLILVDEPEISLHVAWQSRFLSDLIDILRLTDAYALVATHSPVVIGAQWNLAVQLEGPPRKG